MARGAVSLENGKDRLLTCSGGEAPSRKDGQRSGDDTTASGKHGVRPSRGQWGGENASQKKCIAYEVRYEHGEGSGKTRQGEVNETGHPGRRFLTGKERESDYVNGNHESELQGNKWDDAA